MFRRARERQGPLLVSAQTLLASALLLIEQGWTQGADARDSSGTPTEPWSNQARSWSLLGALVAAVEQTAARDGETLAVHDLAQACVSLATTVDATSLTHWNDHPARTKTDITTAVADALHDVDSS
jgi:hypothetical protein